MIKNKENITGFTLLETLIALSVLSVGIMAAFTLSTANLNTARANYQRILAANLAREGVEFIRNVRDSNWLKIESNVDCDTTVIGTQLCTWDQGLDQVTSTVGFENTVENPLDDPITGVNEVRECFGDDFCRLKIAKKDGEYNIYKQGNDEPTNMARLIILKAICRDTDGNGDPGNTRIMGDLECKDPYEDKIGLQVKAQLFWVDFSKEHTLEVMEEIYNWREYEN